MDKTVLQAHRLEGSVVPPGDKSISQRAILLNSIATGPTHVSNLCVGDDRASILRCMRGLGAEITRYAPCVDHGNEECFHLNGGGPESLSEPVEVLDAGNSGTTTRLVTGLLAAQPFFSIISGDRSLRSRPMDRIVKPLSRMGAQIFGRNEGALAPLAVRGGGLKGIDHTQSVASAQVKSSLLIAGLHADGATSVSEPVRSRDHTERMLHSMGADIAVDDLRVTVRRSALAPVDVAVPGDISSAAFWLVAGCAHPNAHIRVEGVGINPTRSGVLDVLRAMGAELRLEDVHDERDEPVADIVVESSRLVGTEIHGEVVPRAIDELPALALAASLARGTTVIRDAGELRVKESDRIAATVDGLTRLGARIEERPDGMAIHGVDKLKGAQCDSYGDHRIAMTMAIAGLIAEGETVLSGVEAGDVSYPGFWDVMRELSGHRSPVA